ncbi:MAG: hypothetical protein ACLUG9_07230 [Paraclostridium sordellii]
MLTNLLKRNKESQKKKQKIRVGGLPRHNIVHMYSIRDEQNIEVKSEKIARTVGKSMNYRPLEIKSKRLNKTTEEDKSSMYKQTVPQYNIIKKLVGNKSDTMKVDRIDYKNLDSKIKELEEKRKYNIDLLELDLYSSYVDDFYILKSYMDRE